MPQTQLEREESSSITQSSTTLSVIWREKKNKKQKLAGPKKGTLFLPNSASHFVKAADLPQQCSCLRELPVPWGVCGGVGTLRVSARVLPFLSLQHHDHCGPVQRACL